MLFLITWLPAGDHKNDENESKTGYSDGSAHKEQFKVVLDGGEDNLSKSMEIY